MNKPALTNKPFGGTITSLVTNGTVELSGDLYNHGGADLSVEEYARTRNLTDFQMVPEDRGQLRTEVPAGAEPMTLDNRIGKLNNGLFYAYVDGYSQPPLTGPLAAVETALGLTAKTIPTENQRAARNGVKAKLRTAGWNVNLRFQHPPWDAPDGLWYQAIQAENKACANAIARRMARDDGHLAGGCGRATFTAHQVI